MGPNKFIGSYYGKFTETNVNNGVITSVKGSAELTIAEVGKGAYLVTVVEGGVTTYNTLAYLQQDHILIAQAQTGEGITSTYFEGNCLIHQWSNKSTSVWTVKNYKFSKCKK